MGGASEARISFDSLRDKNLMQLKKLNTAIFPVRYNEKYYADALSSGDFTKLAYYSDICVGAIACRLEKKEGGVRIYIMTLGVLAPYRGLGIGSKLLKHCLDLGFQDPSIVEIYLHVQTNNEEAISFYQKFGFEIKETIKNYYSNIDPPDCYVLAKSLTSSSKPKSTS
eukprot:TRINITY_DN5519_c0_g1_i4.p1 TRINITY_DN5519_c0_g1~~TRINITY_DN5519_c0_g1_i4.p1  ORF type:complete len:168 (+),score=18.22 TRINITY_DN5519_c0_g1_i4:207-710(+)